MNLALLLDRLNNGNGIARMTQSIARELLKQGHEVHLYTALPGPVEENLDVAVHWIPSLRGALRIWSMPIGACLLNLKNRHDAVISNSLTLEQDVIVMHNDPQAVEHRKLAATPFKIEPPTLNGWKRSLRAFLERERFAPGRYRQVVALSQRSAREITEALDVPPERLSVVPHGIDSEYFSPAHAERLREQSRLKWGIPRQAVVFLYVGDSWKGLEFAIRALSPIQGARLFAVGPFSPKPFEDLARSVGLTFSWARPSADIRAFYALADAFVLPTPLDSFGLCVFEAMAMGIPVIVSQYAGVTELLSHGTNAWILQEPSDVHELATACQAFMQKDFRQSMAERGRRLTLDHPWARAAEKHLAVYRRSYRPRSTG